MSHRPLATLLRHARALAGAAPAAADDRRLLAAVAAGADDAAFAALLDRYGPLVWSVCRRLLACPQDAEDAFQATFLVLARRAGSVRNPENLAAWLYGVAYRVSLKARRAARTSERIAPRGGEASADDPAETAAREELRRLTAEELAGLPEKYRQPLILCYLQGRTHRQAAADLGWPSGSLSRRVEKACALLRDRLARRGVAVSVAAVMAELADAAAEAAPPALVEQALRLAGLVAAGAAAAEASPVLRLADGIATTSGAAPLRAGLVALLLVGAVGTGVGLLARAEPPAPNPPAAPPAATAAQTLRVVVLDPQGKPLPGANIHAGIWTDEKPFKANRDYTTDAAGAAEVELPKSFYILRLWASKKPFVTMFANWEQNELASGQRVPAEYTMRLESGVTAGGRVVDEQGQPIAGAKVEVRLSGNVKPAQGDGRTRYDTGLATGSDALTTDAEGRWHIDNFPDHPQAELSLQVSHPDFVFDERWRQKTAGVTNAMLRQGTATLTLKRGVIVRGRVTDPAGRPIKDALVVVGDRPYYSSTPSKFPTDADGRFRLPALPPRQTIITVIAPGFAPQLRKLNLQAGLPPQDFRMEPGKLIRLRVVDASGKPLPKASVHILGWRGSESLDSMHNPNHPKVPDTGIPRQTDADGVWEWPSAPDEPVKLQVSLRGSAPHELEIAGGAPERTVTLAAEPRITGRVTDAVTGQPIPAFTVIPIDVFRKDFLAAERGNAKPGKDGRLDYLATRTDIPLRLRIEAPGYRSQDGPEFRVGDDSSRTQDFRLQPSPPITGVVLDAAGKPVANAEVLLATPIEAVELQEGWGNHKTATDAAGAFSFPDTGEPFIVLARADAGFAQAEFPAGHHDAGTLRLRPWASVRGHFRDGGQPVRGATVFVQPVRIESLDRPRVQATLQTVTGPDGGFEFPRVPPGPVCVAVSLGPWRDEGFRSGPHVPLDLKPGERAELDLGGAGANLTGRVKLTGKVPADLDCTYSLNHLVRREPGITPPPAIAELGFDVRNGWRDTWQKTLEGQAYLSTLRSWFVKLAPDGSFRVSGVPPGEYDLAVEVYAKPSGCLVDPLARNVVRVTVTEADAARGDLAVPEITAEVVPVPAVGDTPSLAFRGADGREGTLADSRGRYTLVHFWASWCAPCKQQLPALRRLHERFAGRGLATLGLSLDHEPSAWQTALKQLELPWPQGRLASGEAGVSSVPAYWLLDPAGKIVAKAYDPDELAAALDERLK